MTWASAIPQDTWGAESRSAWRWLREMWQRGKTFGSFTWNPPNVPANSTVTTTLTTTDAAVLEGLRAGQAVTVTPPSAIDEGLMWSAFVGTDDTLSIRLANVTGGAINAASGTWVFDGKVI